jgi:hypothetical protein
MQGGHYSTEGTQLTSENTATEETTGTPAGLLESDSRTGTPVTAVGSHNQNISNSSKDNGNSTEPTAEGKQGCQK